MPDETSEALDTIFPVETAQPAPEVIEILEPVEIEPPALEPAPEPVFDFTPKEPVVVLVEQVIRLLDLRSDYREADLLREAFKDQL